MSFADAFKPGGSFQIYDPRTGLEAKQQFKQATIEVVVLRANGDREQLGVVSYWHKNPLKRLAWRLGWRRL